MNMLGGQPCTGPFHRVHVVCMYMFLARPSAAETMKLPTLKSALDWSGQLTLACKRSVHKGRE
eukprot:2761005-Amphidinium_carterae.1